MAALNLYRYADVFKSKDVKGSDLPFLDRDKLMVSGFLSFIFFTPLKSFSTFTLFLLFNHLFFVTVETFGRSSLLAGSGISQIV